MIRRFDCVSALVVLLGSAVTEAAAQEPRFVRESLPMFSYKIFDLGVVDANGDGALDVFTTNCQARAGVLFADGRGGFRETAEDWGLEHTPAYPGFTMAAEPPEMDAPGVYVYFLFRTLYLRAHRLAEAGPVSGSVDLISTAAVPESGSARIDVTAGKTASGQETTHIDFAFDRDGELTVVPNTITGPMVFRFESEAMLPYVFFGADRTSPETTQVQFDFNDPHGLAWSDLTGDGRLDVFMSTGALQERAELGPTIAALRDRVLTQGDRGLGEREVFEGIEKSGCAGRGVAWVDFDSDGDLDLFVTCARDTQSKLFRRNSDGRFEDVARVAGLGPGEEAFRWLDFDGDGDADLLIAHSSAIWLYTNEDGGTRFTRTRVAEGSAPEKFTVADFDRDGDPDVFAAAREPMSYLLVNDGGGRFDVRGPERTGIPPRALAAQWVDFDNDGAIELHVLPGGLFRPRADGRFERLRVLDEPLPREHTASGLATWFDADGDGDQDAVTAIRLRDERWDVALWRNHCEPANWIEIDLVGSPGNREAIGAAAVVQSGDTMQRRWVGDADGARSSQGHYRLYFGLGEEPATSVRVAWPDGVESRLEHVEINRRLTIRHDAAAR